MGRLATWPSRTFTLMASIKTTAYTASRGRLCHSAMPSMTRSVIVVIVCLDTSAPYTSARCAQISPWVSPFADRRSEEHTSELQSLAYLVCRLLLEKNNNASISIHSPFPDQ